MTSRKLRMSGACAVAGAALVLAGCTSDDTKPATSTTGTSSDSSECGIGALTGTYLYEVHGDQQFAEGFVPFLEVGLMTFDGDGGITRIGTDSTQKTERKTTMTYTVGADCVGELTLSSGASYRATVSPSGDELTFFASGSTRAQTALDGEARRVGTSQSVSCGSETLTGTYQYRARGSLGAKAYIEHGFEVYDGAKNVTNAYRVAGLDEQERLTGTYAIGDDCHATVTYDNGQKLDQYVAPDGSEFYWIQTGGFQAPGIFGGHEHRVSTSTSTTITTGVR